MRVAVAAGIVIFLIILGCPVRAMQALAPPPQHTEVFNTAKEATWGVALLRFTPGGELETVALSGSGFFVSNRHFVTAAHVIDTRALLGRTRGPRDEIRVFRADPFEDGFHGPLRIVFESGAMDAAVLESSRAASHWLRIAPIDPKEGEEVGLYGYPLAAWSNKMAPVAYALGRVGIVAGFGRDGNMRRMVTTLVSNPGNSGGPVFRLATGEAIAIHKAQLLNPAGQVVDGYSIATLLSNLTPQFQKLGIAPPRNPP